MRGDYFPPTPVEPYDTDQLKGDFTVRYLQQFLGLPLKLVKRMRFVYQPFDKVGRYYEREDVIDRLREWRAIE